jgi:hypothetical protein
MAVYTEVSFMEASALLRRLNLGELSSLRGIEGGIENTNYFVTTQQDGRPMDYVLTLFERLTAAQLPFYLHLMKHLAQHGLPVPDPAADQAGSILHSVQGKPAAVVNRLRGHSELAPTPAHCAAVGTLLGRMHLAARDFDLHQPNLRGLAWWNQTVPVVLPHLSDSQAALMRSELAYQNHVAAASPYAALPRRHAHRRVRFLFCRRRYLAVRSGGLPERLVHRPSHRRASPGACRQPARRLWRGAATGRRRAPVASRDAACRRPALLDFPPVGPASAARGQHPQGA